MLPQALVVEPRGIAVMVRQFSRGFLLKGLVMKQRFEQRRHIRNMQLVDKNTIVCATALCGPTMIYTFELGARLSGRIRTQSLEKA